ncbi:MAG: ATP-binding cassette domain-containing protein [Solirubrobacteraceae bacterium]
MTVVAGRDVYVIHRAPSGDVAALRGLSLTVEARETVAVLGPSGAGKSSLLAACAGRTRPSTGDLDVLGVSIAAAGPRALDALRREQLALVPQNFNRALPRDLTVEEIVGLPLRLLGRWGAAARETVAALLRRSGLTTRAEARPRELSGGEQQRVAVCAALIKGPKLVLADEPTGQLDAVHSKLVIDLLLELSGEAGASVLVVTHDPAIAARTARTVHVRDGRVSGEGAVEPVLVVDRQGWLRIPRSVRDAAGLHQHVRASARRGAVVLTADDEPAPVAATRPPAAERRRQVASTAVGVEQLDKSHGTQRIFQALTHEFAPGRLHVVAGPSGCGKTTLLDLIAALDVPDRGVIRVAGEAIDAGDALAAAAWRRRTLGHLSQHASLAGTLTARENVELGGAARGMAPAEARDAAERWLEWVGLAALGDRPAELLSGGEQRRVALARAVIGEPSLIVADEPTAHLDRANGATVLHLLKRAAAEHGATVIVSSHDPDALEAADEVFPLGSVGSKGAATCSAP